MYCERTLAALLGRANVFPDFVCRSGLVPGVERGAYAGRTCPGKTCFGHPEASGTPQILSKRQLLPLEDPASSDEGERVKTGSALERGLLRQIGVWLCTDTELP